MIKINDSEVKCVLTSSLTTTIKDSIFDPSSNALNQKQFVPADNTDLYGCGLLIIPYYSGSGYIAPSPYPVSWGFWCQKDYLGYSGDYFGYIKDDAKKTINHGINQNFANAGESGWGWDSSSNWSVAICFYTTAQSNYSRTVNGQVVNFIDFGENPILIIFRDNRFDDFDLVLYDEDGGQYSDVIKSTTSDGYLKLTIQRIPKLYNATHAHVSTGMDLVACRLQHLTDGSFAFIKQKMFDIPVSIIGLEYHSKSYNLCDPSSVEMWKSYLGQNEIYHKQKTLLNCWIKYGIVVPENVSFLFPGTNNNYTFITPTKAVFYSLNTYSFSKTQEQIPTTQQYCSVHWSDIRMKIIVIEGTLTVSWQRTIENGSITNQDQNPTLNGSMLFTISSNTDYTIPSVNIDELRHLDLTLPITLNEMFNLTISADNNTRAVVEFVGDIDNNHFGKITSVSYPYDLSVPTITDYNGTIKIQKHIYNEQMWNNIKLYFEDNPIDRNVFLSGYMFALSDLSGDITINMPANESFAASSRSFYETYVEHICFKKNNTEEAFTSMHQLFEEAFYLNQLDVILTENDQNKYLCRPHDMSGAFNYCVSLKTYSPNLINWNAGRGNVLAFGEECTLMNDAFSNSGLEVIPEYSDTNSQTTLPLSNTYDNNTIVFAPCATSTFENCSSLVTIGPILDFGLLVPSILDDLYSAAFMFENCTNLENVRIKNLNHGTWYFDRNCDNNHKDYLGDLSKLSKDSVEYLFNNVVDLANYDQNETYVQSVKNSFLNWYSYYKNQYERTFYWQYKIEANALIKCKWAFSDNIFPNSVEDKHWIAYINEYNDGGETFSITFKIEGLDQNTKLYWMDGNSRQYFTVNDLDSNSCITVQHTANTQSGFILTNSNVLSEDGGSLTNPISIIMNSGLDMRKPRNPSASIYCPIEWENLNIDQNAYLHAINCGWSLKVIDNGVERNFNIPSI